MGKLISVRVFTSSVFGYVGSGMVSCEFMCYWGPGAYSVWLYPTSTDPILEIFPGYQLQFSGFGTEAGFHGTSFTSEIPWCLGILGISTIR